MADEPISTLRVCKHCRIEKPLTEFVRQKGYWMHKCTSCKKAHRRVQYHNREGEYANLDTEAERAKRRESGRQARGRYVWDESWLKKRSEEHTSELQSLMRISSAVFCLKKKKKQPQ